MSIWIIFFNCIFFLAMVNWWNFKFQNVKTDRSIDEALETVPDHIWPCPVNIVAIPWLPVAIDTGNKLAQRIITSIYYQGSELTIEMPQKLKKLARSRVSSRSGYQNLKYSMIKWQEMIHTSCVMVPTMLISFYNKWPKILSTEHFMRLPIRTDAIHHYMVSGCDFGQMD